jgi:hypothetical protein
MVPIVAKGDAKERRCDMECRENRSSESAGNFGDRFHIGPILYHIKDVGLNRFAVCGETNFEA